jgi:glycosyltransferase involved in cell wall biosynthesis
MNIAIDISPLETGHNGRGVGVYTKMLIESLKRFEPTHSYSYFTHPYDIPETTDIVHYPYFDPYFLTLPFTHSHRSVVTIHDMIPIVFRKHFPSGFKGGIRWNIQKFLLKKVIRVIADSDSSAVDIHTHAGVPVEKIRTVYLAPTLVVPSGALKHLASLHVPEGRFIMYVGDVNWNKNIPGLLHAFAYLKMKYPDLTLVLVGRAFQQETLVEVKQIRGLIQSLDLEASIRITGHVSDTELHTLYVNALCTVQPSIYEGFGLPVVDALLAGCPVVCANTSSLKEIAGPSIMVDAHHSEDIARGVMEILHKDKKKRDTIIEKGKIWVKQFTWEKTARSTMRVYDEAIL